MPDEPHLLLAPRRPRREVGAVGPGVVVRVHEVDLGEARERRLHLAPRVRLEPLHVGLEDDLEPRVLAASSPSRNPVCRSCPGVEVIRPSSSTIRPFPPSVFRIHSPAARPICRLSAPMKQVNLSPSTARSRTMTGMPASYGLGDRLGEGRRLAGADDDEVDLLADELLHVRALHEGVVLRVLEDDLEARVGGRRLADVRVHLLAPGLAEVALAHPDDSALLGLGVKDAPASARPAARRPATVFVRTPRLIRSSASAGRAPPR